MRARIGGGGGSGVVRSLVRLMVGSAYENVPEGRRRVASREASGKKLRPDAGGRIKAAGGEVRAVPAFELAILRAIFHSKGPKA
jgi:hypothetical protein